MKQIRLRLLLVGIGVIATGLLTLRVLLPKPALWEGRDFSRAIYDRDHHLLRLTLTSDEKYRLRTPLAQISPAVAEATLFQEDRSFRRHPGVNPVRLLKAAWDTYVLRHRREGGSTITMQLARIRFGIDSRTVGGKLRQMGRALELEWYYSKDELLEAYLNLAPYGGNIEGVGAASLIYFHRPAGKLTVAEAATLAVIPQNPTRRSPSRASRVLLDARDRLWRGWKGVAAVRAPDVALYGPDDLPFLAPHLSESLLQADPFRAEQVTTLDLGMQGLVERQLNRYVESRANVGIRNAAAMLVDWRTMAVVASVGSADFFDETIQGQVDGTRAKRSPGSALKPFIYGLAFDQGLIQPQTVLKDAPTRFEGYNPENFDGEFVGPIPAAEALVKSRNVPALLLAAKLRSPSLYQLLQQAHVSQLRNESDYGLSIALGSAETSMQELAGLYAMLASGGRWRPLRLREDDPTDAGTPLLSEEASFMVLDALRGHGRPGQEFRSDWTRDALPVAWKTGTSYAFRDAWCIGVFGPYVLAVWIGNFDGEGNRAFIGAEAAAPLLFNIVDSVRTEHPEIARVMFVPPKGVARVKVCAVSGDLPGPHCPHTVSTWFIPGRSPIHLCDIHREVLVDTRTGRRTCEPGPHTRSEVYEFWPSDLERLFREAGLPRRAPPIGEPCGFATSSSRGQPPQIVSPQPGLTYSVPLRNLGAQTVPFSAVTDADVREVFWFLDDALLTRTSVHEPFFWKAKPGSYVVRVVDDQGRADARQLKVELVQ